MKKKLLTDFPLGGSLNQLWRIMKLTILFSFCCVLMVTANSYSQSTKLSLNLSGQTIKEVLNQVEEKSEFIFLYKNGEMNDQLKVNIDVHDATINEILDKILSGQNLSYNINNRQVIISKKEVSNVFAATNQSKNVSGKVKDSTGASLPGVSVVIKGTTNGTITDGEGRFTLAGVQPSSILQFSFVGMKTQEVQVGSKSTLEVVLTEESIGIEEVVAIGYGSQKRVNITGSVATVSKETIENKSVPNAIAAIQGALPGVVVTRGSGQPGSESFDIEVRGKGSANNMDVLVIVDGAPGSISELNPNDIETMTVLKDAAACAIYGSNAAGGVILVTTKRGKAGKTIVDYSGIYGLTMPSRMPQRINSWEEAAMQNIANINSGGQAAWTDEQIGWMKGEGLETLNPDNPGARWRVSPTNANAWDYFDNVNFVKEFTRKTSSTQTHNLSIKGGNEKNAYLLSFGYYDRQGILKEGPDKNNRYNLRLNMNTTFNKYLSLDTWLAYTNSNILAPAQKVDGDYGILYSIYQTRSIYSVFNPNGDYNGIWDNPLGQMNKGGRSEKNNNMLDGKANLKIKELLPGLVIDVIGSKRLGNNQSTLEKRTIVYNGPQDLPIKTVNPTNSMEKYNLVSNRSSLQAYATYNFNIQDIHNFTVLGGYAWEDYREEAVTAGASNLVTNDFFSLNWGDAISKTNSDLNRTWATMSAYGRLNYNYKEKYLFEANMRYDGSSRLAPDNRWHAFPSLSAAWRISNEDFFSGVRFIENLKLRASWGQLGNSNAIGNYDYMALLLRKNDLPFNNQKSSYIYQDVLPSRKITWETIQTANAGIDFNAFNNRLSFSGDYYVKQNKEMLAKIERSSIIGVKLPYFNVGELKSWGWEISLGWRDKINTVQYWVNLNLSDSQNKLIKYDGKKVVGAGTNDLIEGMPLNTIWGYKTDGMFQTDQEYKDYGVVQNSKTGAGDIKYLDLNDDDVISAGKGTVEDHGDLVRLGDNNPRYTFGIDLGARWKGFDFSAFFQGVGKRDFVVNTNALMPFFENWRYPLSIQRDFWTVDNPDAFWPRPYRGSSHNYAVSDKWVQNAAYIRLKNIQIGYSLPQSLTMKAKISKVRIFVSGQDLWESTNVFEFIDPETPNKKDFIYPFYRVVSTGLNITF